MGEIALMVREEILEEEDASAHWKSEADRMLQMHGWGDEDSEIGLEDDGTESRFDPFLTIEDDESWEAQAYEDKVQSHAEESVIQVEVDLDSIPDLIS